LDTFSLSPLLFLPTSGWLVAGPRKTELSVKKTTRFTLGSFLETATKGFHFPVPQFVNLYLKSKVVVRTVYSTRVLTEQSELCGGNYSQFLPAKVKQDGQVLLSEWCDFLDLVPEFSATGVLGASSRDQIPRCYIIISALQL
jgi:hypothetical protein